MKLYVFAQFDPRWSDGLAFAIAEDVWEAKELIMKERGFAGKPDKWGPAQAYSLNKKIARSVPGRD